MLNLLGLFGVGYLAAAGVATNAAVVGRGLVRAARSAAAGNLGDAAVEALGAVVAPVALGDAEEPWAGHPVALPACRACGRRLPLDVQYHGQTP